MGLQRRRWKGSIMEVQKELGSTSVSGHLRNHLGCVSCVSFPDCDLATYKGKRRGKRIYRREAEGKMEREEGGILGKVPAGRHFYLQYYHFELKGWLKKMEISYRRRGSKTPVNYHLVAGGVKATAGCKLGYCPHGKD